MAYTKRIPPIKLILTIKEYNYIIGVLTKNIEKNNNKSENELSILTKEKLLKYGIPKTRENGDIEIELRLYNNEIADILSEFISFIKERTKEINYFEVLLKVRENNNIE